MENLQVVWVYLLKDNHSLLKLKLDVNSKHSILTTFQGDFLDMGSWIHTLKQFNLPAFIADDDLQNEYYISQDEVPYFWEIKTNILSWISMDIDITRFDDISNMSLSAWVIHVQGEEWNDLKDIFLFQSFHKSTMYFGESHLDSLISFTFTSRGSIFKNLDKQKILNLRKKSDVIFLWDTNLYIFNRKRYNIIFNFEESLRRAIPSLYDAIFVQQKLFFITDALRDPNIITLIQGNTRVSKKIYNLQKSWLFSYFDLISFTKHVNDEGILWIEFDSSWKVIVKQEWLEILIDALNSNFFTDYNWNKFQVKAKNKRV